MTALFSMLHAVAIDATPKPLSIPLVTLLAPPQGEKKWTA